MNDFEAGYRFFENNAGAALGMNAGEAYINSIQKEIDSILRDFHSFKGFQTNAEQLKGDVAEFWHAGTFNIDAAVKGSKHRVAVDRSHGLGSADASSDFGMSFGMKYYQDGAASAKQQAKSIFERYQEYRHNGGKLSIDQYLLSNGVSEDTLLSDPLYSGQIRVIPKEQIEEAAGWLERKIAKESLTRPEQVKRYQETLDLLKDRIEDNKGVESIPLSSEEARKLAEAAKNDGLIPEKWGLTTEQIIQYRYILKQSLKAGLSAATISMVLKAAPEVYQAIGYLIRNGQIDEELFLRAGFSALSGAAEGFLQGALSAAITSCCSSGLWGTAVRSVDPSFVGAVSIIAMNTLKNAVKVARRQLSHEELYRDLARDILISACSVSLGLVSQYLIEIPVFGYMLGSFVGSVAGSLLFTAAEKTVISFCITSGCTMFGLVKQDYRLPDDVLRELGLELFEYETAEYQTIDYEHFEYQRFCYQKDRCETIGISFLRRGVIGVSKIGYLA